MLTILILVLLSSALLELIYHIHWTVNDFLHFKEIFYILCICYIAWNDYILTLLNLSFLESLKVCDLLTWKMNVCKLNIRDHVNCKAHHSHIIIFCTLCSSIWIWSLSCVLPPKVGTCHGICNELLMKLYQKQWQHFRQQGWTHIGKLLQLCFSHVSRHQNSIMSITIIKKFNFICNVLYIS